jgi:hypothetical protein
MSSSEKGAQTIADWLNKVMPSAPLPWNNEDAKRFQIAMESISLSMKALSNPSDEQSPSNSSS